MDPRDRNDGIGQARATPVIQLEGNLAREETGKRNREGVREQTSPGQSSPQEIMNTTGADPPKVSPRNKPRDEVGGAGVHQHPCFY